MRASDGMIDWEGLTVCVRFGRTVSTIEEWRRPSWRTICGIGRTREIRTKKYAGT